MSNKKLDLYCSNAKATIQVYEQFSKACLPTCNEVCLYNQDRYVYSPIWDCGYYNVLNMHDEAKGIQHNSICLILPETGLHPKQQAEFMHNVMHNSQEVYVLTHSEHIFHEIRLAVGREYEPEDITIHFYKENEIVYPKINYQGRIDIWSEGFFDQSGIQLEDLLNILHPLHPND